MGDDRFRHLPYRPCVGVMLFNPDRLVWIGRRADSDPDEGEGKWWQMPQGGIDAGEDVERAALRELKEETGVTSASVLELSPEAYRYDVPQHLIGTAWGGRYRGQEQRWVACRFEGEEAEIDISGIGHEREFDAWRWARLDELAELIVPFKRAVYLRVIEAFRHLAA